MYKYHDQTILDMVQSLRKSQTDIGIHPLDSVTMLLRNQSNRAQLKRLYGCTDPAQAAGRACHGDAFRMK